MHHRLGGKAWTQHEGMPKASAGEGEIINAPSARALRLRQARLTLLLLAADVFRVGLFYFDLRMINPSTIE